MNKPNIQTTKQVVPMLYGYSTPEVVRHNGWTKIGYTEQDVETRINQQTHTADVKWHLEWKGNATFDDGSGETFIDKDFHAYLRKSGIEQENGKNNEWFHVDGTTSKQMFRDFREDHGIIKTTDTVIPYKLREEQQRAVAMTVDYQAAHKDGEFLWNAKPRFGKTLSVYDFVQKTGAEKVLIVTNRPAIANSWFSDYAKFLGSESGYLFVSEVDALKGKRGVLTREEIVKRLYQSDEMKKRFPENKERLKHIFEKQVYGLAPTEIIYKIATSYILGFDEDTKNIKHNFRQLDALPYAKDGTLEQMLDELYSEDE